jgi:hypothetical protein
MSRPELQAQELRYLGLDRSEMVLKQGRQLFRLLGGKSRWQVHTERRPVGVGRQRPADVLVMANFLNEMEWGSDHRARAREDGDELGSPYEQLIGKWEGMVANEAAILVIEPGMRASGRNLVRLREAALVRGWRVEAPCPHAAACPMPGQRNTAWCHFNFAAEGAPLWLEKLSSKAKLPKDRASLSFLLLTRGAEPPVRVLGPGAGSGPQSWVRVVSESFDLPDWQRGRYGCSERGLVLLQDRKGGAVGGPRPGDLLQVTWPEHQQTDQKSGALIVPRIR